MKNLLTFSVLGLLTIVFAGCPIINNPKYDVGVFPLHPVNFTEINSEYDDYNSALPVINHMQYLFFSSNKNSQGENFDVVGEKLNIWWDKESGLLTIDNTNIHYVLNYSDTLLNIINTNSNEFGPNTLGYWNSEDNQSNYLKYDLVTFSSNFEAENYKSKFAYFESEENTTGTYHGPFDIHMINQLTDAQYISFFSTEADDNNYWEINPLNFEQMIFNANIDGRTGIYKINFPENDNFIEMLKSDTIINPVIINEINSSSQDKCPFVNAHLMVFTSDRSGGFGGYDLYYSWYENGIWSEPVNFGENINTEYDEFRPVTLEVGGFANDLMIFSSNRPGGKGGYDLYYVGLPFKVRDLVYVQN